MKLKEAEIKDFLSIKSATISFTPSCRILVGINESGKSNLLKALRLLDPAMPVEKKYTRDVLSEEDVSEESRIDYVFTFEEEDLEVIFDDLNDKVLSIESTPIISLAGKKLTLKEFVNLKKEALYRVDILQQQRTPMYYTFDKGLKPLPNFKKISTTCPKGTEVMSKSGEKYILTDFTFINTDEIVITDPSHIVEMKDLTEVTKILGTLHTKRVGTNLPKVIFWQYDDLNLLPPRVDLATFIANPSSYVPLERMFNLAGYEGATITTEINTAKSISQTRLTNFLRKVADKNTAYFKDVWEEYPEVSFDLKTDGPDIVATIKDADNNYDLNQRSDGFKRFITFLLLISTQSKIDSLKKSLLIIDEPEISLHPRGADFLKEELLKIAQSNIVVYSTHSIFMIDQKEISRHYIVKKKKEITKIEEVKDSNIQDEEVIYKSLGYSIFSNLKEWNIIFEGWRDKEMYVKVSGTTNTAHKAMFKALENVGRCHSQGVKHIQNITPAFEAGERKCIILSDADTIAKEKKKDYEALKGYGTWYTYHDLDPKFASIFTAEDFFDETFFLSELAKILTAHAYPVFTVTDINATKGRIESIRAWYNKKAIVKEDGEVLISEIKDALLNNLKPVNISALYFEYISKVSDALKALQKKS